MLQEIVYQPSHSAITRTANFTAQDQETAWTPPFRSVSSFHKSALNSVLSFTFPERAPNFPVYKIGSPFSVLGVSGNWPKTIPVTKRLPFSSYLHPLNQFHISESTTYKSSVAIAKSYFSKVPIHLLVSNQRHRLVTKARHVV